MIVACFAGRSNKVMQPVKEFLDGLHASTPITQLITGRALDGPCNMARDWAVRNKIKLTTYEDDFGRNMRILDENPNLDMVVVVYTRKAYHESSRNLAFLARLRKIKVIDLEIE